MPVTPTVAYQRLSAIGVPNRLLSVYVNVKQGDVATERMTHPPRGSMKPRPARCQLVELRRSHHAGRSSATYIPVQRTQRGADIIDQACRATEAVCHSGTPAAQRSRSSVYKHSTAMAYRAVRRTQFEDSRPWLRRIPLAQKFLTAKRRPLTCRTAFKPCQPPQAKAGTRQTV